MVMPLTGNVLVTGGSGTLGHAIVRTALHERWDCAFTIYSRSELRQAQMRQQYPGLRYVLGDVRDYERLSAAIAGHDVVIHAAAMKRLPECDAQPVECYQTNVQGSINVLRACQWHGVKRLIAISTDKACAASTAYGASKLMMERAVIAPSDGPTICTGVRYGNVVASNGSVVPIWRAQAAAGKPLTVTDPTMTRFWMAPSDAVRLIECAATLDHGLIVVPKMGSLSIAEMAAIVAPGAKIIETGLRFAEKHHEDLIAPDEFVTETATHYLIGKGKPGTRFTSYTTHRLTPAAFRSMLAEGENS
jgi:UDP-N-acetylglucosamine 4,6-dehydratase/5-epimerase